MWLQVLSLWEQEVFLLENMYLNMKIYRERERIKNVEVSFDISISNFFLNVAQWL